METIESVFSFIQNCPKIVFNSNLKEVKSLTGGCCNYVYRLVFENNSTCVLKYYPINPPNADPSYIVSQDRYAIEKTALQLLETRPWLADYPNSIIRVPRIIHYDDSKFVLIMEDAGTNCKTLLNLLSKESDGCYTEDFISQIAKEIRIFSSYLTGKSNISETHKVFENNKAWERLISILKYVYGEQAKKYSLEKELEPYVSKMNELFKPINEEVASFIHGDFWPNSILIDVEMNAIWVIDWEMSRFENELSDFGKLMNILWLMKQNNEIFNSARIEFLMNMLQEEFLDDKNNDWRLKGDRNTKGEFMFWLVTLVEADMWKYGDPRETILKAIEQVEKN